MAPKNIMMTAALLLVGATSPVAPVERVVTGDGVVAVSVNDIFGRMRIDPGAVGLVMLSPAYAARAGLKGGGMLGFGVAYHVGNTVVFGRTQVARLAEGGAAATKRRVGWAARPYAPDVDAVVGPAGIDAPVVRFVLAPPRPGERDAVLPMIGGTGLFGSWFGLHAQVMVGGEPLALRFVPRQPRSVANAGAARRLAAAFDGQLGGEPAQAMIAFGIERAVRTMTLAHPWPIGSLALSSLAVRTADTGSVATIREADAAPDAAGDPDEVVVTGKSRRHDPHRDRVTLGADLLSRCSSIVFDKPARRIRLTCG